MIRRGSAALIMGVVLTVGCEADTQTQAQNQTLPVNTATSEKSIPKTKLAPGEAPYAAWSERFAMRDFPACTEERPETAVFNYADFTDFAAEVVGPPPTAFDKPIKIIVFKGIESKDAKKRFPANGDFTYRFASYDDAFDALEMAIPASREDYTLQLSVTLFELMDAFCQRPR